ncbi:OmpA family protein [Sulfitobacter sp. D35]|uniref:OmpA family protein n=1 Tax=Sulfitobacter sp. D35 TaxID=3083252 RepID=UPI00296E934A|nr:OmpA family protein [Sulfitobacter sp. D35]MDW4500147.1 OmpA family protein [Sulfitobacter sp. D35]
MSVRAAALAVLLVQALPAAALEPDLPQGARLTVERASPLDVHAAPVGIFADAQVPMRRIEGTVLRRAWRIPGGRTAPLQIAARLREQYEAAGYAVVLDCASRACGGFDFRFAIEVLPGPNMYVDLRDYHAVTAIRGAAASPDAVVSILASRAEAATYLQVIEAESGSAPQPAPAPVVPNTVQNVPEEAGETDALARVLLRDGHVVLSDLDFPSGRAQLGTGPFASLAALAQVLQDRPGLRIALVGHTDSTGSLAANIGLSRDRARAVRQRLVEAHGADPDLLEAEGMGYLAPRASNLTPDGREANRRVEAIVLSQ